MNGALPRTRKLLDGGIDFSPNSCYSLLSGDDMVLKKRHDANALMMMRGEGQ